MPAFRDWIDEAAEAVLIVEFEGDDPDEVAQQARALADAMIRRRLLVANPVEVSRRGDCERLLGLRRTVAPLMMRMKGPARPVPFIEDVAVPPEALPEYLQRLQNILKQHDVSWTLDAHAGQGVVHTHPFLDMADSRDVAKLEPLATQVFEAAWDLGGTISGEHGCGLARTQFLRRQYGELVQVFREIKDAFDPLNVLNPGKVIGDDPHLMTRDLRRLPAGRRAAAADRPSRSSCPSCAGRTAARSRSPRHATAAAPAARSEPTLRMCPTFRALRTEAATPRAKANLVRQLADRRDRPEALGVGGVQGERRPLHPLQPLSQGMPVGRRRLEPDARGEGRLRREPRAPPARLAALAGRTLVAAGEPAAADVEHPDVQPGGPLVVRAVVRALAAPPAPQGPSDTLRPPRRAAAG